MCMLAIKIVPILNQSALPKEMRVRLWGEGLFAGGAQEAITHGKPRIPSWGLKLGAAKLNAVQNEFAGLETWISAPGTWTTT